MVNTIMGYINRTKLLAPSLTGGYLFGLKLVKPFIYADLPRAACVHAGRGSRDTGYFLANVAGITARCERQPATISETGGHDAG